MRPKEDFKTSGLKNEKPAFCPLSRRGSWRFLYRTNMHGGRLHHRESSGGVQDREAIEEGTVFHGVSQNRGNGRKFLERQPPADLGPVSKSDLPPCTGKIKPAESCRSDCPNSSYPVSFSQDKHHAKTSYSLSGEDQMMRDIYQHGPVTAAFSVYSDFVNYKVGKGNLYFIFKNK